MAGDHVHERRISIGGLTLFVREQGEGHPLLMFNGIGGNADMWGSAGDMLALGSRTISIDSPGTGRSDTSLFPLPMTALSRLVLVALDELGHERVDVMGFSFGGALAQQVAFDAPERVRRLALVATGCGWGSKLGSLAAIAAIATPFRYLSTEWYALTNRFLGENEDCSDFTLGRFTNPPTALGHAHQIWALATWSSRGWLHRIESPTLVISGGRDQLIPVENALQLARLVPQSRLHVLPAAAHLLMYYNGGVAPLLLADFFTSESLDGSRAWQDGVDLDGSELREAA
jgi:pimeloyl-ACP methyl ester carboxylesterase